MEIFGVAFMILWVAVAFLVIRTIVRQGAEKSAYKKMISNPCDATVSAYIPAFNATYGFFSTLMNMDKAVNHRNNMLRQAQGWEIISANSNVSPAVKEQLKNAFVANGVPIKINK